MAMTLNANEQERVNNVYNQREKALAENNSMYEGLINDAGAVRDQQNAYLAQQQQIQNENLDKQLAYQEGIVNQQKEEAKQNQRVEENKAKNAYQNYINPYGLQNERLYSAGLGNSGVSETSKLGAYTTYQNRVSSAAGAYQKAITNYDNDINQARLNNDVQKAQNALNKLKLELQNTQDYYSNIASLSQQKLKTSQSLQSQYLDQYNTVYNQILNEKKFDESVRQWNKEYSLDQQKLALEREKAAANTLDLYNSGGGYINENGEYIQGTDKDTNSFINGIKNITYNMRKFITNGNPDESKLENTVNNMELYQFTTPSLSGKDKEWYNKEFEKHSYKFKDLDWVLRNAQEQGKLSPEGANLILDSYSVTESSRANRK